MRKPHGWVPVITEIHKYKIVLDTILEFIHQIPDEEFLNPEKPNFTVKDFTVTKQVGVSRETSERKRATNGKNYCSCQSERRRR